MKHTEYLVRSNNFSSSAQRRYTDFEVFYDLLVARYPYRYSSAIQYTGIPIQVYPYRYSSAIHYTGIPIQV